MPKPQPQPQRKAGRKKKSASSPKSSRPRACAPLRARDLPSYELGLAPFAFRYLLPNPYAWQIEAFASIEFNRRTSIRAANGSGKTQAVIAPAILWWLYAFPRGRAVVTSGSWIQVEKQLWPALTSYRGRSMFAHWTFNVTEVRRPEGGWAIGWSTNEPGRAEGYHQRPDSPLLYIIDEAKSVEDGIMDACNRCTCTRVLIASSPGAPEGFFFRSHNEESGRWHRLAVTSADCPHIDPKKRAEDLALYGEDHPVYRSMHLGEFTYLDQSVILSPDKLRGCREDPPPSYRGPTTAFCDFAAGGDENVLAIREGNRAWIAEAWRDADTIRACHEFKRLFGKHDLKPGQIYGDATGLGTVMIDYLAELRCRINRVHNGEQPQNTKAYADRGSEIWFEAAKAIERKQIILEGIDPETARQLTTRKIDMTPAGKLKAEPKEKMKARGLESPDRADALLGAIAMQIGTGALSRDQLRSIRAPASPFAVKSITRF